MYPDYDYGLNNMAIPESLARQDYWYRTAFDAPANLDGKQLTLTFKGINYAAEVWINGTRLGNIRGAFIRGVFDVTGRVSPGKRNVIAVRFLPPTPEPHEESIAAGPARTGLVVRRPHVCGPRLGLDSGIRTAIPASGRTSRSRSGGVRL